MARSITVALELDDRSFNRGIKNADGQVNKLSGSFGGLSTAIKAATAIGAGFAVKGVLDATLKMENFRTTLTAYLGSQQAANSEIERLTELANKLPQDLDNITEGFIVLQRNGIDTTSASLEAFSKVAAGNSKDFTQLAEAVADALTGEFERLKEFGVKVSKENDQFAIRFADGSEKVVNSAQEVVEAVRAQGEEGGKFAEVVAGPLNQAFSNLNGVLFEVSSAFGEGFAPAIAEAATGAKEMIKQNKELIAGFGQLIGEALQWMLENLDTIVVGIKAFVAAWAAFKIATLVTNIGTLITAMASLRTAIFAVNAALLANPITAIATALAAAAVLIVTNWETVKKFFETLWQNIMDYGQLAALNIELYWEQLRQWFLNTFTTALQAVSDAFYVVSREAQAAFAGVKAAAEDPLDAFDAYKQAAEEVRTALDEQRAAQLNVADSAEIAAWGIAETEAEIAALEAAIENRAKQSTEEQAEALDAIAPAAEEAADSCQMFKTKIEQLETALTKATDATKKNNKALTEQEKLLRKQQQTIERITGAFEDSAKSQVERLENEREILDYFGEEREVLKELNRLEQDYNRTVDKLNRSKEQGLITEKQHEEAMAATNAQYEQAKINVEEQARANYEYARSFEYGFKEAFNKFREDSTNAATLAGDLFETAAQDWRNAWVEASETGDLSFKTLIDNMKKRIVAFLADAAFIKLTEALADAFGINLGGKTAGSGGGGGSSSGRSSGGGLGGLIDKGVDFVKGLFGFSEGGYVAGNKSVIVGERGPEIFTPASSGTIIPNFAGMGGGGTQVTYNINAVDSASFVEMLSEQPEIIHSLVMDQDSRMFSRRL